MGECKATLSDGALILENSLIRREVLWRDGLLGTRAVVNKSCDYVWRIPAEESDFVLPRVPETATHGRLEVAERGADAVQPSRLEATVTVRVGRLEVRRVFRLYDGCPAIACDYYFRGPPAEDWLLATGLSPFVPPPGTWPGPGGPNDVTIERLCMMRRHLRLTGVQFFDATDYCDNLVRRHSVLPYNSPMGLKGNLLFIEDLLDGQQLFVLREAPCSDAQLAQPSHDFIVLTKESRALGAGLEPRDLRPDEWTRGYGAVVGVAGPGELEQMAGLRQYQRHRRVAKPGRDNMIMLNTWGDRGEDKKMSESFALSELEAGRRLGVTHFQLDAGWHSGPSGSTPPGDSLANIWKTPGYWDLHSQRFPRGLGPVADKARELCIELCIWFNPSTDQSYSHWQQDADVLIGLHRQYGIRTFKIDGVEIPDKQAERNLRAMLDAVNAAAGGEAVFNLDVTAGRRFGYHYCTEYGNFFLENRYTDWGNYYPYRTLRNLWMLARYVPPQSLQIEFLNNQRNPNVYGNDEMAPGRAPFEYCFAITMAAQPLAWFEASQLPESAFAASQAIGAYRRRQLELHEGMIFPIGDEPRGQSWTGLQSLGQGSGYVLVYREKNDQSKAELPLWGLAGRRLRFDAVIGQGRSFQAKAADDGRVEFELPEPFSYAMYRYGTP